MNGELLDRPPPHDLDAERGVIGSILLDPARLDDVRDILRPDDFHAEGNKCLFRHFLKMRNGDGGAIDAMLLLDRLQQTGDLEKIGGDNEGAAYLAEVVHSVPHAANAAYYAKIVKEKAARRRVIHAATDVLQAAYNGKSPTTLRGKLQTTLERIDTGAEPRFKTISSVDLDKEDYTATPIITEALFAGVPAVIGAPFKTCKSLVAIDAAISIATGRPFLGSWSVPQPMSVVYFSGEGGPCVAQDYGQRIALSKGIDLGDATQLRWCFSVPRLESLEDLDAFTHELDNTAAEVVILDNLMLCLSGNDAGNVYKMGSVLGNVIRLCSERNVTPVFIHHSVVSSLVYGGRMTQGIEPS